MCGIVGIASRSSLVNRELLVCMRDTMRHRGPDDAGTWISDDGRVGLAQRRLAIIDLSPAGHQPMADASGKLHITFNGEIYNYRELQADLVKLGHHFHTGSDTEVLLESYRAWGVDCLEHLNGMFAFALYDDNRRRLFVARDRAGEKPLFYLETPDKFAFASELKALIADPEFPRRIDVNALHGYLAYGYVMGSACMLEGIRKLPQGHALEYDVERGNTRIWRYWQLPQEDSSHETKLGELVEEFESLLGDSVRLRLISDVPLGVMLSGGIDSSLVTAFASRSSSGPTKTFTISMPGESIDEAPYARIVARHFGTEHSELPAEPATVELLPELARQYDEPIADHSMIPTFILSRLIRQHVTVALGGDGGDELFGGYKHYRWISRVGQMRALVPQKLRAFAGAAVSSAVPVGARGRQHFLGFAGDADESVVAVNHLFDPQARRRFLSKQLQDCDLSNSPEEYKRNLSRTQPTLLRKATSVDFQTYMVDDILTKVDRASMLTSLEVRAPMLDHRIIEFAFRRLPDSLRATASETKVFLRKVARRHLPAELDLKRKQGFSLPLKSWFKGEWGGMVKDVIGRHDGSVFNPEALRGLIAGQERGLSNTSRLFAILMFELWRGIYKPSI